MNIEARLSLFDREFSVLKVLPKHIHLLATFCLALSLGSCTTDPTGREVETKASAEELLMKGQQYKQAGRIELSRKCLLAAIKADENSHAAKLATQYLKFNLPKEPITIEAEQRNIIAHNQAKSGDIKAAKNTFANLIKDYPNFEWPYANLAALYAKEHDLEEAETLLRKALSINPDYANARGMLVKLESLRREVKKEQNLKEQIQPD